MLRHLICDWAFKLHPRLHELRVLQMIDPYAQLPAHHFIDRLYRLFRLLFDVRLQVLGPLLDNPIQLPGEIYCGRQHFFYQSSDLLFRYVVVLMLFCNFCALIGFDHRGTLAVKLSPLFFMFYIITCSVRYTVYRLLYHHIF
jgi:hypothetical protein